MYLLAYGGLRIGEALALQVGDLDLENRRVSISRTWADDGGKTVLDTTKSKKTRKIPVHSFVVPELEKLTVGVSKQDFVFRAPRGGAQYPNNWRSRTWVKAIEGTEFKNIGLTAHDLRHTAASTAIASGADVKVVQTMLGHASAVETLDTYGHLWPDRLDEVSKAVEAKRATVLSQDPVLTNPEPS